MKAFYALAVFVAGILGISADAFAVNQPPAPMPVVRFNLHTGMKRIYGKALNAARTLRNFLANVGRSFAAPIYGTAGSLNLFLDPLPVFPYQQAPIKENMPRSVHIRDMQARISGTIDVSGGTTDGTLQTEPIARLIRRFTVRWDSFDLIQPMPMRDLAALGRRLVSQPISGTGISSPGVQTTNFELIFYIPFARAYNADPFDTALPPLTVRKEFVAEVEWDTTVSNSGSSLGSGAIIAGGDRDVILSNVQLELLPRQARTAGRPWYLPQISAYETVQYSAANPRLTLDIEQNEAFDGILFRELEGANRDPINRINNLSFETKNVKIFEEVTRDQLRGIEEDQFPGVLDANEAGNLFVRFSDGGKLGNVVNPSELTLPKFEFDVSAPATNPAVIRAITMELLSVPGVTRK